MIICSQETRPDAVLTMAVYSSLQPAREILEMIRLGANDCLTMTEKSKEREREGRQRRAA